MSILTNMPVTKTAKRALRSSERKKVFNMRILNSLERATRSAKREKTLKAVRLAISFCDKAAKKGLIHKNKAARFKSRLAKLIAKKSSKV